MIRIIRKEPIRFLEYPVAGQMDFIVHAFCTRQGGVSSGAFDSLNVGTREGDGSEQVRRNYDTIAKAFGISASQFLLIHQVHRDGIWVSDGGETVSAGAAPPEYDAVLTDRTDLALCIKTADCVPLFLADPVRRIIGAVHAGWRGTALQIAGKAAAAMVRHFGGRAADLSALIGPAIGPCCYEVDTHVYRSMQDDPERDAFFRAGREEGKWMFDLVRANRHQLLRNGVPETQIRQTELCTACHPELFFSHRAQKGHTGRQLNFIMMRAAGTGATKSA